MGAPSSVNDNVYSSGFAAAITPSDDADDVLEPRPRAIYVGTSGTVVAVMADDSEVEFVAVPAGAVLPIRPKRIVDATTTADDIVGLY